MRALVLVPGKGNRGLEGVSNLPAVPNGADGGLGFSLVFEEGFGIVNNILFVEFN